MEQINVKTELKEWLVDYITDTIHGLRCEDRSFDNEAFNGWAHSFKREEAAFVVNMEFVVDWGYSTQEYISNEEACKYAQTLIQIIVDKWYL